MESEREFDVRSYIMVLARRWGLIRDLVLLAVVGALLYPLGQPVVYEARAGVALVKTRTQVEFDAKFLSLPTEQVAGSGAADVATRRNTLAALVKNVAIAQAVAGDLASELPAALREPAALLGVVEGAVVKGGDIIEIKAQGEDPELLAAIANRWAVHYEAAVNGLYATGGASGPSLQKELAAARSVYETALAAQVEFTGTNRIDELSRLIAERQRTSESLEQAKLAVLSQEITITLGASLVPLAKEAEAQTNELASLYRQQLKVGNLLADSRAYRQQLAGGGSTGDELALLLLKTQAYAASVAIPGELQLQLAAPAGGAVAPSDVDRLIRTLEERQQQLAGAIAAQSGRLQGTAFAYLPGERGALGGADPAVFAGLEQALAAASAATLPLNRKLGQLQGEILALQQELAQEQAVSRELSRARDQAWETYATLARKVDEATLAAQVPGTEVKLALPAVAPRSPQARVGRVQLLGVGVFAGLLVGIVGALGLEYLAPQAPTPGLPWGALPRRLWRSRGPAARPGDTPAR